MHCLNCKSEDLTCEVTITKFVPFAKKGGNINVAGHAVSQKDIVDAWLKKVDGTERDVLHPIICLECGQEHEYHKGQTPALRKALPPGAREELQEGIDALQEQISADDEEPAEE